jgi:hypothetical protein
MGRGGKVSVGQRSGLVNERQSVRGSKNKPWDPMSPEDDPLRDLRVHEDDQQDPANDEYVWPEYTDEDED